MVLNEGEGSLKFILNNYWLTAVATTDELPPAMFFDVDSDQFTVRACYYYTRVLDDGGNVVIMRGTPRRFTPPLNSMRHPARGAGYPAKYRYPSHPHFQSWPTRMMR